MIKWLHQLLNPHCEHCREEEREKRGDKKEEKACKSCETLQHQLEIANREKEILLNKLFESKEPHAPEPVSEEAKPIQMGRRFIPSVVRREMMDENDRASLQAMIRAKQAMTKQPTEITEKEVIEGLNNASEISKTV